MSARKKAAQPAQLPTFHRWLITRKQPGDNWIDDLAGDVKADNGFPKSVGTRRELIDYLKGRHACDGAIKAATAAWRAWQRWCEKQVVE
jgi:uncharacterized protein YozE (UPF0346 family)